MLFADDLLIFASVIDAGSFTRAAENTGIPKSTLSRRLATLETELGGELIQRTTRQLLLTDLGLSILEHARQLQEQTSAAIALAQNRQAKPQGVLRVSMPPEFHELYITSVITQYQNKYPDVRLFLDFSARRVDLIAERFDVAVRASASLQEDPALKYTQMAALKNGLYASQEYIDKYGIPQKPEDLAKHVGLMLVASSGELQPWILQNGKRTWTGMPDKVIEANSLGLQKDLCTNGVGIVGMSWFFAKDLSQQNKLIRILPKWHLPTAKVWCVTPGRRLLPQRTIAFIEILQSVLSAEFNAIGTN